MTSMTNESNQGSYGKRHQNQGTTWMRCMDEEEEEEKEV
jgi:hypothetical protein